jgi:hypothetical protein
VPLFVALTVRSVSPRRALAIAIPAIVVAALVLLAPHASQATLAHLEATWDRDGFPYRADELQLFARTQAQSWDLYSFSAALRFVMPVTLLLLAATIAIRPSGDRPAVFAAALGAIVAPLLLIYAGWDVNRWQFFTITNFFVVMWLALDDGKELRPRVMVVLVIVGLLLARMPLGYIQTTPRQLGVRDVGTFVDEVTSGALFEQPTD